jgi:3-oxoadipate enol-lactonase
MTSQEHKIIVEGGHIHAEEIGDGPPVLLSHAGVTDRRVWDPLLPALADRHRVIRYDSRGYGRSPRPTGPYSLVTDALAVLDQLDVDRAHLVGLSQGAATSLDLALRDPARVVTLTLVAPGLSGFDWPRLPGYEERAAAFERGDLAGVTDGLIRLWAPLSTGDDFAATLIRDQIDFLVADDLEVDEPSAIPRLAEVTAPTLVVLGADDLDVITEIGDLLATRIPNARRVMLDGADHILPLRVPDELTALLVEHLGS